MKYAGNNFDTIDVITNAVVELNPFKHVSNIVDRIVDYNIQSKIIDGKIRELKLKSGLAHHLIDVRYKQEIKKLDEAHSIYKSGIKTLRDDLKGISLDRKKIHKTLDILNDKLSDDNIPYEIRFGTILSTINDLTTKLGELHNNSRLSLDRAFSMTMNELDKRTVSSLDFNFKQLTDGEL